jgi:hypothetical protein
MACSITLRTRRVARWLCSNSPSALMHVWRQESCLAIAGVVLVDIDEDGDAAEPTGSDKLAMRVVDAVAMMCSAIHDMVSTLPCRH